LGERDFRSTQPDQTMTYKDQRQRSRVLLLHIVCTSIFLVTNTSHADIPTPEQECRHRNSAICEVLGVQHYIEGGCPQGAIVIRPQGNERCDELATGGVIEPLHTVQRRTTEAEEQNGRQTQPVMPPGLGQTETSTRSNEIAGQTNQIKGPPRNTPARQRDMTHNGKTGHWLITVLTAVAVLGGIFSTLRILRRFWLQLNEQNSAVGRIAAVFRAILSLALSGYAFYYTFGLVYMRIFDSFSNHETFGPAFFAAPPAFFASILAAAVVFYVAYWAIGAIVTKYNNL